MSLSIKTEQSLICLKEKLSCRYSRFSFLCTFYVRTLYNKDLPPSEILGLISKGQTIVQNGLGLMEFMGLKKSLFDVFVVPDTDITHHLLRSPL